MSATMRYFRVNPDAYATAAATLDGLFGHPNGKAQTCLPADPWTDGEGIALLAVRTAFLEWPEIVPILTSLLESGEAGEISEQIYREAVEE